MDITNLKSVSDNLSKYDYLVKKGSSEDFIQLIKWKSEEGYYIALGDDMISLSEGTIDAINHLRNSLMYNE